MEKVKIVSYIHSRCCTSHWELVITSEGNFELLCEKCGHPSGIEIKSKPSLDVSCDECGGEVIEKKPVTENDDGSTVH